MKRKHERKRINPAPSPTAKHQWCSPETENLVELVTTWDEVGERKVLWAELARIFCRGIFKTKLVEKTLGLVSEEELAIPEGPGNVISRFYIGICSLYRGRGYTICNQKARECRDGKDLTKGEIITLEMTLGKNRKISHPSHAEDHWYIIGLDYVQTLLNRRDQAPIIAWCIPRGIDAPLRTKKLPGRGMDRPDFQIVLPFDPHA